MEKIRQYLDSRENRDKLAFRLGIFVVVGSAILTVILVAAKLMR